MKQGMGIGELRDEEGNLTGHLVGLFHRTIQFMENGIKPIWVFDGKPPELKAHVLDGRKDLKEKAEEEKKAALEIGDLQTAKKMAGRSVRITKEMIEDAKTLLRYIGCPVVEAPGEAEAVMCGDGERWTGVCNCIRRYGCTHIRNQVSAQGIQLKERTNNPDRVGKVLEGFGMNHTEFIDLCILCGCDYTVNISGVGPVKAFNYIKNLRSIERVIEKIQHDEQYRKSSKYNIPDTFYYKEARELFNQPDAITDKNVLQQLIKWNKPSDEELINFLVKQKGFNEQKVDSGLNRLKKCVGKSN
eukprot:CAMPEP_0202957534 /NCGR_PEP_ID=MMETSP1396-20130829/1892_1 /ASSEMBLY_ACC=CAM_ASM_000872 /TAXON_ID= /ORGANISM="Pseudokeronopsis sp., Strain Brazil" /LENGTH=300 /DNA_ID=CAMNT_0049675051 /DNA_START=148 /DNA_END=1050 /DNA_ORIENTATION=+